MAKKTPTPRATFTKPTRVAPEDRNGPSTVDNPVAVVWLVCLNDTLEAGAMPSRRDLMARCLEAGVGYNTARTQVQRFRSWHNAGADPAGLPRGISIA